MLNKQAWLEPRTKMCHHDAPSVVRNSCQLEGKTMHMDNVHKATEQSGAAGGL